MANNNSGSLPDQTDVVIVGAGVAGLYCAWRLLSKYPRPNVVLLERLNRTGGRLDTDIVTIETAGGAGEATVREEEGGMRFNYSMDELMALNSSLALCDNIVPFPMSDENTRFFIRGKSFTAKEAGADNNVVWSQLYNLAQAERNKSPVQIITDVYHRILAQNGVLNPPDNPTPEFWQKFRLDYKWNGIALNRWQLWGLLREMGFTQECITMLTHTIGFEGPFLSKVSAGEAFQILEDFPKNPKYFTFEEGYSELPNALAASVESMGGQIFLNTNVETLTDSSSGGFDLTVSREGDPSDAEARPSIKSPKVILAIASNALETLYHASPALNSGPNASQLWDNVHSVVNMRLMKINLYYREPWWGNGLSGQLGFQYGPSFSDLPINAVYPFSSLTGDWKKRPAALTIYCDFDNTEFWAGLQNIPPLFQSPLQEEHSKPPQTLFPASQAVVNEATRQFKEIFNTHWVPDPLLTSYRLWAGMDNFGYAYHQWGLNVDDRAVIKQMIEPVQDIYICNETYSDMQGWVNGSLRSADLVLQQFGLAPLIDDPSITPCKEPEPPPDTGNSIPS